MPRLTTSRKQQLIRQVVFSKPFIVRSYPDLDAIYAEKGVQSTTSIFRVQFQQPHALTDHRGQTVFASDRKRQLRESLLGLSPHDITKNPVFLGAAAGVGNVVTGLSIFACDHEMQNSSMDRNALGNIRYQVSGVREVAIASYADLKKVAVSKNLTQDAAETFMDFYSRVMHTVTSSDVSDGLMIFKGTISPKDSIVTPMGTNSYLKTFIMILFYNIVFFT